MPLSDAAATAALTVRQRCFYLFFALLLLAIAVPLLEDSLRGAPVNTLPLSSFLYFSFVLLTSTGMSDIMPVLPMARMLCVFEMITGVLFVAVLIARLAGTYPLPQRR